MTSQEDHGAAADPPRAPTHLEAGSASAERVGQEDGEGKAVEAPAECSPQSASDDAPPAAAAPAPPPHDFPPAAAAAPEGSRAEEAEAGAPPAPPAAKARRVEPGRHLLRHALTPDVMAAAAAEFGTDKSAAGHAIWALKQPELRSTFAKVYRFETRSSNNSWMRSKLLKAVGVDATWIPEQPETPQEDAELPQHDGKPPPEPEAPAAAAADAEAAAADAEAGPQRRPVRKAALAHRPWRASEVATGEDVAEHPRRRRKHAQPAKPAAQGQQGEGQQGERRHMRAAPRPRSEEAAAEAQAASAAAVTASVSTSTEDLEEAASPGVQGRKRQPDAVAAQPPRPSKRPASPDSAQSPAPPSAVAAAAFGMMPPAHAQQLAAAVFEAAAPWPSSGSGSTAQPLADAWPRMLASAALGAAPVSQQLGALPPLPFAALGAGADPATERGLLQLLLEQQALRGPVQLHPAHWAALAAQGQPPQQLAAALQPGQLAMLGPGGPPVAVQQLWGGQQQMPLIAVMGPGFPQPQPLEQQALQQLAAVRLQQSQLQQRLEAQQRLEGQLLAAGLLLPAHPHAAVPIRLAALPAAAPGAAVRPPTPHGSQLQPAALLSPGTAQAPASPRAPPHMGGGTVASLPPGWAAPAQQQPWPAYATASSGGAPSGSCDVQQFKEQQMELEWRAQQYRREHEQAQQTQQQAQQRAQQLAQQHPMDYEQAQQVQQPQPQQPSPQQQQTPSPFAAYAAIAPPDAHWPPQQVQGGGAAAAAPPLPAGAAAGAAAAPREPVRPTVPHHTLSADLHMLFAAYADGQVSLPLPQGPS